MLSWNTKPNQWLWNSHHSDQLYLGRQGIVTWQGKLDAEVEGIIACSKLERHIGFSRSALSNCCCSSDSPGLRKVLRWHHGAKAKMENSPCNLNKWLHGILHLSAYCTWPKCVSDKKVQADSTRGWKALQCALVLNNPSRKQECGIHLRPLTSCSVGYLVNFLWDWFKDGQTSWGREDVIKQIPSTSSVFADALWECLASVYSGNCSSFQSIFFCGYFLILKLWLPR